MTAPTYRTVLGASGAYKAEAEASNIAEAMSQSSRKSV
jgi:hypothetical protein